MGIPVKVAYRASSQFPVLYAIMENDMWAKVGLDVKLEHIPTNEEGQAALVEGKVDFVFGNHVSPYHGWLQGHRLIYLAQTFNLAREILVTNPSITSLEQLRGKEIGVGRLRSHPTYTIKLLLERWGLDPEIDVTLKSVGSSEWFRLNAVLDGTCPAAFVSPPFELLAQKRGLNLFTPAPMGMVWGVTLTTNSNFAKSNPEACRAMILSLAMGIHFIKTRKQEMMQIMTDKVAPLLEIDDPELIEHLYNQIADLLDVKPYPTLEAIENIYTLACRNYQGVEKINPLMLWDLHFLRELDESGALDFDQY